MPPLQLFVSYSHADKPFLTELEKHLSTLKRENLLATWHDRKITPGQDWESEIDGALQRSEIIVFLISPDFIASEYCVEKEVATALDRHGKGDAIVIPIVVRPVDWLSTPIGKIQGLPTDAKPISTWNNQDEAWLEIAKGIRLAISDLNKREATVPKPNVFMISQALTAEILRLEKRYEHEGAFGGMPTGLYDLDNAIDGLHPGDLIFIGAAPVMDRMALLAPIVSHVLVERSHAGLIFTLRQSKEQFARRLCAAIGRLSVQALLKGELEDDDWANLTHALGRLNDAHIFIVEESHIDIDTLISQVDLFKQKQGGELVIIDSFEHITGGSKPELLAKLGRYARSNKVAFIVAGGLDQDPSLRINKRPLLKDVGDWIVLNEDLDCVALVYQDEQYNPDSQDKGTAEIIIAKNSRGQVGAIRVTYLRNEQVFKSFADHPGSPV